MRRGQQNIQRENLVVFVNLFFEVAPDNAKENTLQTIRQNANAQSSPQKSANTIGSNNIFYRIGVRNGHRSGLSISFNNTDTVGAGIGHDSRNEANTGISGKFAKCILTLGDNFLESIESCEPRVVADKCSGGRGQSTVEERRCTVLGDLGLQHGDTVLAFDLHSSLECVHRDKEDTESASSDGGTNGLYGYRNIDIFEQGQSESIGGSVTET